MAKLIHAIDTTKVKNVLHATFSLMQLTEGQGVLGAESQTHTNELLRRR